VIARRIAMTIRNKPGAQRVLCTMTTRLPLALLALVLVAAMAGPASAATKKPIYVSLGDSLAWSYSVAPDGSIVQSAKGYTELLAAKARQSKKYGKNLTVKKFACPSVEDTTTYQTGGRCSFFKKSQQSDSIAYIKKNRKRIGFITLSLGNNNFTPCSKGGAVDIACVQKGNTNLDKDLPKIYKALRKAAGKSVPIVTFNVYDPYLALYLQGADYRDLALLTVDLARQISASIETRAKVQKIKVADAFGAFKTAEVTSTVTVNGQPIPVAVGAICSLTFMCRPAPVGPNIHPTDAGYAALATAAGKQLKIN
jgi:lysophospholipase L1-like esterase